MLLDKEVQVKTKYNYDLDYYTSMGYNVQSDFITVKIEHLPKNSFTVVNVSCDYCGVHEQITFYKFNRSQNSSIKKYCCNLCKGKKIKESNLQKYGVTSVAKLQSSKDKSKQTNLEKFGHENAMQSDQVKTKLKQSIKELLGVENPMQSDLVKQKQKDTTFCRWNVDNISKNETVKLKKRQTCNQNWGVEFPIQSEEIKTKIKKTILEKYEKEYFTQSDEWRKLNYQIAEDPFYLKYLESGISVFNCDLGREHQFEISKDVYSKRKSYRISLCTVCNPVGENRSIKENDLFEFISRIYDGEIIKTHRDGKWEIDIYLPQLNLGFEFNGLYWHSEIFKSRNFHKNKSDHFWNKGIRIIHIWEDDWDNKREIVLSLIKNLLGRNQNKIGARHCQVRIIDNIDQCRDFLNKNHIQGNVNSNLKIGLFHNDELVSLMTFDHFEGRKKMKQDEWNLNRFCSKIDTSVAGGATKLFSWFLKTINPKRVVSYADLDWSKGDIYHKLGFNLDYQSDPDYKYIIKDKRVHKSKLRKSFTDISESKLNIPKIWDCGKIKFSYLN